MKLRCRSLIRAVLSVCAALLVAVSARADTASVVNAANAFKSTLSNSQISALEISLTLSNAEVWSNLPGPARNGLKLGNLSSTQLNAALAVMQTALSASGYTLFSEIRAADDLLGASQGGYGSANYYIAFLGTPSTTSPWMLQVGGHHLAFNITYNGPQISATPEFDGVEPPNWTANGVAHAPLEAQRAAVQNLAQAIQADSNVASAAKLSGTFTDVVHGPNGTGGYDRNFPQAYPTSGRGALYTALTDTEKNYVKAVIEAWVNTQASDIAAKLLADYESDAALNATYVGYGVGTSGTASFPANPSGTSTQRSYLRVDGPRVWIEFIVQQGVVYSSQVHYHTLWRDKIADYGAEFGAADSSTSPTITSQPASVSVASGGSAIFSVTAAGTGTLTYQWYKDGTAVSGATSASYTVSSATAANAGSYYVKVTSPYGVVTSSAATLTVDGNGGTSHPAFFTGEAALSNDVYYLAFSNGNIFGYYTYAYFPYLYHFDAGFLYFIDGGNSTAYLYDFTSNSWWFTSPSLWPYLYDFNLNHWLYYFPDTANPGRYTRSPRYFYDFGAASVIIR